MTNEEIRIKVAEACGWSQKKVDPEYPLTRPEGRWEHGEQTVYHWGQLPDYLNDLNAMHEAEKVLTKEQWFHYNCYLFKSSVPEAEGDEWDASNARHCIHATAAQRAEAFLKTFKLWKTSHEYNNNRRNPNQSGGGDGVEVSI